MVFDGLPNEIVLPILKRLPIKELFRVASTSKRNRELALLAWKETRPVWKEARCVWCIKRKSESCFEATRNPLHRLVLMPDLIAFKFLIDVLEYEYQRYELNYPLRNKEAALFILGHKRFKSFTEREQWEINEMGFAVSMFEGNVEMLKLFYEKLNKRVHGWTLSGNSFYSIADNQLETLEFLVTCEWGSSFMKIKSREALQAERKKRKIYEESQFKIAKRQC